MHSSITRSLCQIQSSVNNLFTGSLSFSSNWYLYTHSFHPPYSCIHIFFHFKIISLGKKTQLYSPKIWTLCTCPTLKFKPDLGLSHKGTLLLHRSRSLPESRVHSQLLKVFINEKGKCDWRSILSFRLQYNYPYVFLLFFFLHNTFVNKSY